LQQDAEQGSRIVIVIDATLEVFLRIAMKFSGIFRVF